MLTVQTRGQQTIKSQTENILGFVGQDEKNRRHQVGTSATRGQISTQFDDIQVVTIIMITE